MFSTIDQISQTWAKFKINLLSMVLKKDRDFKIVEGDKMWTISGKRTDSFI